MNHGLQPSHITAFATALSTMDRVGATRLLQAVSGPGSSSLDVIEGLVVPALDGIGRSWEAGDLSLSQVYMGARICEELIGTLPGFAGVRRLNQPRVAMAALDDHHLLGKRIVLSVMRGCGFVVDDFGVLDTAGLAARVHADGVEVLLVSVLMLRSALRVRALRAALDALGARPFLIVGGAPFRFDATLWREVGADGCGRSASDAVTLVERYAGAA